MRQSLIACRRYAATLDAPEILMRVMKRKRTEVINRVLNKVNSHGTYFVFGPPDLVAGVTLFNTIGTQLRDLSRYS